jgi:hypothetical protein
MSSPSGRDARDAAAQPPLPSVVATAATAAIASSAAAAAYAVLALEWATIIFFAPIDLSKERFVHETRTCNTVFVPGFIRPSSSKYARSGRKFKLNVCFGWFLVSFRNKSVRSGSRQFNKYK